MAHRWDSDETESTRYSLASATLRAFGHGCLIAAGGMGLASLFDIAAVELSGIAGMAAIGMGCMIGARAIGDTAILADAERRRRASDDQYREDAAVDAFVREREAGQDKQTSEHEQQKDFAHVVAAIASNMEQGAVGIAEAQTEHVARLRQKRQNRVAGLDVAR